MQPSIFNWALAKIILKREVYSHLRYKEGSFGTLEEFIRYMDNTLQPLTPLPKKKEPKEPILLKDDLIENLKLPI